jgi:PEP-CTERM motif
VRISKPAWLLAALLPLTASATPYTYTFSAILNQYNSTSDDLFEPPPYPFFTPITGSFTIEDSTPADFSDGYYSRFLDSIVAGSVSIGPDGSLGSFVFGARPLSGLGPQSSSITFINDLEYAGNPPYDQFNLAYSLNLLPGDPLNAYRGLAMNIGTFDTSLLPPGQLLTGPLPIDTLLALGLNLSLTYGEAGENGYFTLSNSMSGDVSSMTVTSQVPEPATLGLLAFGLAGCVLWPRRKRGHSLLASS